VGELGLVTEPATVVIPTLGRETLAPCLRSLRACRPAPAEVLVIVQGSVRGTELIVKRDGPPGARLVSDDGRGAARSRNRGLREASHPTVLMTDDDCEVDAAWVGVGAALARDHDGSVLTGRVLPGGDPDRIPSCKTDTAPHDFTGTLQVGALYSNNMVLPRDRVLQLGGFDERFGPLEAAEDCDLCYRWLRAGLPLRYEPTLIVRHNHWRSEDDLARLYVRYARGSGAVYGKHLRRGDLRIARFLLSDLHAAYHGTRAALGGRPRWTDSRQGILRGLPGGLLFGLRHLGSQSPKLSRLSALPPA
jgi:GT2 family glycosyltransferase